MSVIRHQQNVTSPVILLVSLVTSSRQNVRNLNRRSPWSERGLTGASSPGLSHSVSDTAVDNDIALGILSTLPERDRLLISDTEPVDEDHAICDTTSSLDTGLLGLNVNVGVTRLESTNRGGLWTNHDDRNVG